MQALGGGKSSPEHMSAAIPALMWNVRYGEAFGTEMSQMKMRILVN